MDGFLKINSVSDYFDLREQELSHPLIGLLDFSNYNPSNETNFNYEGLAFGCYAIFLKDHADCKLSYGGGPYDFDEGTMVFIAPRQKVGLNRAPNFKPKGYALLFHPDLLIGTSLMTQMRKYTYFSYAVKEALHLSHKERKIVLSLFDKIQFELDQNIDQYSQSLLISNLSLLLDYCLRFFDRQFITRGLVNQNNIEQFDQMLEAYLGSEKPEICGLPTVSYFADQLHLSSNYFGDLVRKETGVSAQEYIQQKILDTAKSKLCDPHKNIQIIAQELGFKYPQHFTRLFKQKLGTTPKAYRNQLFN